MSLFYHIVNICYHRFLELYEMYNNVFIEVLYTPLFMAIDFACNSVSINELLTCSFSLTKGELSILNLFFKSNGALTIKEISSKLSLERSGAQKAVKRLVEIELLEKRQINNQRGGFFYRYYLADKDSIKKRIDELIESWSLKAKDAVQNI